MKRTFGRVCWMVGLLAITTANAAASEGVAAADRIEEDWEVVVGNPDWVSIGPQLTVCMNPFQAAGYNVFTFYINYRDYPYWSPGGLQLKAYLPPLEEENEPRVAAYDSQGDEVFQTEGETIRWTQRMSLANGTLAFEVVHGESTTWGHFGDEAGSLRVEVDAPISHLGGYSPDESVARSGASWQSNRVISLTLVRVRYYKEGQLLATDETARSVSLQATESGD
jgi:hypothetical protein